MGSILKGFRNLPTSIDSLALFSVATSAPFPRRARIENGILREVERLDHPEGQGAALQDLVLRLVKLRAVRVHRQQLLHVEHLWGLPLDQYPRRTPVNRRHDERGDSHRTDDDEKTDAAAFRHL